MMALGILVALALNASAAFPADIQGEWSTTLSQCGDRTTGTVLVAADRLYFWESEFVPTEADETDNKVLRGLWYELNEPHHSFIKLSLDAEGALQLQTEWSNVTYLKCEGSDLLERYLEGKA